MMRYRSKYAQLFERLKREILRGAYQKGQRLPGENEMAQEYGMSRQTGPPGPLPAGARSS